MIDIFIPGKPIGKGRPRVCRKVTYTPKPTKDYEKLVRQCYIAKYADKQPIPAKIPLKVSIIANYPITQSMPKKQVKIIENGGAFTVRPTKKPDADNISKIILDALNRLAYYDDNQVVTLRIDKCYAKDESQVGVYVKIDEI